MNTFERSNVRYEVSASLTITYPDNQLGLPLHREHISFVQTLMDKLFLIPLLTLCFLCSCHFYVLFWKGVKVSESEGENTIALGIT